MSKEDLAHTIIKAAMDANEQSLYSLEPYAIHHDAIIELCLCEHDKIIPKTGRLYRFVLDPDCAKCLELYDAYEKEK